MRGAIPAKFASSSVLSFEDEELVVKGKDLSLEGGSGPEKGAERAKQG